MGNVDIYIRTLNSVSFVDDIFGYVHAVPVFPFVQMRNTPLRIIPFFLYITNMRYTENIKAES